MVERNLDGMLS